MTVGTVKFESETSEFLECSCGNTVMDSGFDQIDALDCALLHYQCGKCNAFACVDQGNRIVTDADDHVLTNIAGEVIS